MLKETKVLVVDDDVTTRHVLRMMIEKMAVPVIEAGTGKKALETLDNESNSPPIVILDWMLPDLSGIEVLKSIRQKFNLLKCYVILLSIKNKHDEITEALSAGANDYVTKPFHFAELSARIKIGLQTLELQKEVQKLRSLLPICAWCKSVKNENDYWQSVEEYLTQNNNTSLTHGICSDCSEKLFEKNDKKLS